MDLTDIQETPIWGLYEKSRNYHRMLGTYVDTDRNYRMYNDDQWAGAKLGDVEPIQLNFIKPIVLYKQSVIHSNLYAIVYSSMNFENRAFHRQSERYCKMLNRFAMRIWERDGMDELGRTVTEDAAVNDEGIIYVSYDEEKKTPVNEVIDKVDVYYGNENDPDIQSQPYILIRKRMPVSNAIDLALAEGGSNSDVKFIVGDNDTFEEAGEAAKLELDDMVTVLYKMYKKNGTVHFSVSTKYLDIAEDVDLGLTMYPLAHFLWEKKKGSARGQGEVRFHIPNQIEVNRIQVRRALVSKYQGLPRQIADTSKISNPQALNTVGGIIKTNGQPVDDVNKIVGVIPPAQMSPDVKQLQDDLIQITRELAGAGDVATGQVDPESASGRAILAVQNASREPLTGKKNAFKKFLEDLARIWLEYLIAYSPDGVMLEEEVTDPQTGEETVVMVNVPQATLEQLKATVKIDITPKSPLDNFAKEQTLENMLLNGFFNTQRLSELKAYVKALDDDSVAPKVKLEEIIEYMETEQRKIAMIQAQAQMMQQRAQQFLMEDPDGQAQQIADARMQIQAQQQTPTEADVAAEEQRIEETVEE